MSGSEKHERTEKPSAKKRKDARRKGQVAKSAELANWGGLLVVLMVIPTLLANAARQVLALQVRAIGMTADPQLPAALGLLGAGLRLVLDTALLVGGVVAAAGVVINVAQVGLHLSGQGMRPQLSRLSPRKGLKRMFGPAGWWEAGRACLKIAVLGTVVVFTIGALTSAVGSYSLRGLGPLLSLVLSRVLTMARAVAATGLLIGLADFLVQRRRIATQLKMTKREVKEEARQSEGDPHVKGAVRRRMMRMSRMRMMAAVADADVMVLNPTHVAVALRYQAGRNGAPRVVAKGADELAARLRAEAARVGVPMVEDPPLARAVYASCEIDEPIPPELFAAVARLLAFIYGLPGGMAAVSRPHRDPGRAPVG